MADEITAPAGTDTAGGNSEIPPAGATPPASDTGTPPAGTTMTPPDGSNGADVGQTNMEGANDGDFDWQASGLNADNQAIVVDKGWKTLDDAVKSYGELSKKLGEKPGLKAPDAETGTPEEWDSYYSEAGRPAEAVDYKFNLDGVDVGDMPYSNENADAYRQAAHTAGLSAKQANDLHRVWVAGQAETFKTSQQMIGEQVRTTHDELQKTYGDAQSPEYGQKVEMAVRALDHLGLRDVFTEKGILLENGAITDATVFKAMVTFGDTVLKEGQFFTGDSAAGSGSNPFSQGSENMTMASQIIRTDPQRASVLIRAAGRQPEEFGLSP